MGKILIIIDEQNDFVTGSLGSEEAVVAVQKTVELLKKEDYYNTIICTQDSHDEDYLETCEGKNLPIKHCIKGTSGWELVPELQTILDRKKEEGTRVLYIEKSSFGTTKWGSNTELSWETAKADSIDICGLCTDICVISNALILRADLNKDISILHECCAGTTKEKHDAALAVMESCQIKIK